MSTCRICHEGGHGGMVIFGPHHHESECRECGLEFDEPGTLDIDESGTPYCTGCGADPREGVAWSTSRGLVVVIPDPEIVVAEILTDRAEYPEVFA